MRRCFVWGSSLKDDDLAGRIGLQAKELNKLMAVLLNDRLVQVYVLCVAGPGCCAAEWLALSFRHRQNELKDGAQRSIGKQYYFIDYRHFCNVVKWRVAEMRRLIDSTLRNVSPGAEDFPLTVDCYLILFHFFFLGARQ